MRNNIVHRGADELTYEIREIVEVGKRFESAGITIYWENIGDPVAKGQEVPKWMKEMITDAITESDVTFAYSPTKGVLETRQYIATERNREGGVQITPEDILFYNGLGDAIANVYTYLSQTSRVIGPDPAYSTHSSAEAAHARSPHITYKLQPHRNWLPDLDDMRNKVKYNPNVAGILIINPDNPTGLVYPKKVLQEIVAIAKEFDLFIISDEIYAKIVFNGEPMVPISQILGDVPGIAMKGLSKEVPWPGARCGWIEMYNTDKDKTFARYTKTLVDAKMLEVCSTTLPQIVLPRIFSDSRYTKHLEEVRGQYKRRADIAYKILSGVKGIVAPKAGGAFYQAAVFDDGVLTDTQSLTPKNEKAKKVLSEITDDIALDKRFVYHLMASTGICVVPLSGMNSESFGFRITLLEPDEKQFTKNIEKLAESITKYLNS